MSGIEKRGGRGFRAGRSRARRGIDLERLEGRMLPTANLILGLSGGELVLTGDATVTSLAVTYNATSQTYTFTANAGETFAGDGTLPNTVVYSPAGDTATLAPDAADGHSWASFGDSVGTNLSTASGTSVRLGDPTAPASNFGTSFELANSNGGTTALTVDDSANNLTGSTVTINSQVTFAGGPTFDYSAATLTSLNLDASNGGFDTIHLLSSPSDGGTLAPVIIQILTGIENHVDLGAQASTLGRVILEDLDGGSTSLQVDDSAANGSWTYTITASELDISSGTNIQYAGAHLAGLSLDETNNGGNTTDVTGTPALPDGAQVVISAFAGVGNAVNLGDSSHPASGLGNVAISSGVNGPIALTIDDSADTTIQTTASIAPLVSFTDGTFFDISGANFASLTFKAANVGTDFVDLYNSPSDGDTHAPVTIQMGTGTGNQLYLGGPANALGLVVVDTQAGGSTSIQVDDSIGNGSWTYSITASELDISSGTNIQYAGASLTGLSLNETNQGGNTANVTGTPMLQAGGQVVISAFAGVGNAVNLGDSSHPASGLGHVAISSGVNGPIALTIDDSADTSIGSTVALNSQVTFADGPTFDFSGATISALTFLAADAGTDTVYLGNSPSDGDTLAPVTLQMGTGTGNQAYLGSQASTQGRVTVEDLDGGSTSLQVDDSAANGSWIYSITASELDISSGTNIHYDGAHLAGLSLDETNNGGNTANVIGTPALPDGAQVMISAFSGGADVVNLGDSSHPASGLGGVAVGSGSGAPIALTIDDSADPSSRQTLLKFNPDSGFSDLTGLGSGALSFNGGITQVHLVPSSSSGVSTSLTVDFANGTPFFGQGNPATSLTFDGVAGGSDSLTLGDSAESSEPVLADETYAATGPGAGTFSFGDGSTPADLGSIAFANLSALTDSTPVTAQTILAPTSGGEILVANSLSAGLTVIGDPSGRPTFLAILDSNKENVTIDASAVTRRNLVILDNSSPQAGQTSLSFELGDADDQVEVLANPAGVALTIDGGSGSQLVTVVGSGLASGTSSSNFSIVGGLGSGTLRINAQGTGSTASLTPGGLGSPSVASFGSGEAATSFAFSGPGTIQEFATDHAPTFVNASPLPSLQAQPGVPLVDVPVATFDDADLIENAGSYRATIDWGDGSSPTSGTIASDPTTPGRYIVAGGHTYLAAGSDTITVTLTDLGGTFASTLVDNQGLPIPVSTQLDPVAAVGASTSTVVFSQASTLDVSIAGRVFLDVDANGANDSGEPGLAGRGVFLDLEGDGTFDLGDPSAITDGSGNFTIANVPAGTYTIRLIPRPGDVATSPAGGSITMTAARSVSGENFGLQTISTVSPVSASFAPFGSDPNPDLDTAIVRGLYAVILGRGADPGGLASWTSALSSHTLTVSEVAAGFYHSVEYDTRIVESDYRTFLGRASDGPGRASWLAAMQAGMSEVQVADGFLASAEFSADHPSNSAFVGALYQDVLGRSGSPFEVAGWLTVLDGGATRSEVAGAFVASDEANRRAIVDDYVDFLGRLGTDAEVAGWLSNLRGGSVTLDEVAEAFIASPEFAARAGASVQV